MVRRLPLALDDIFQRAPVQPAQSGIVEQVSFGLNDRALVVCDLLKSRDVVAERVGSWNSSSFMIRASSCLAMAAVFLTNIAEKLTIISLSKMIRLIFIRSAISSAKLVFCQ